jgi:hypothetical protein
LAVALSYNLETEYFEEKFREYNYNWFRHVPLKETYEKIHELLYRGSHPVICGEGSRED